MTAQELKDWLGSDESAGAGWSKDDGSGETIGHERFYTIRTICPKMKQERLTSCHYSGRNIIKILESNPEKDPKEYADEDLQHMRKVVAYLKRHLAQEEKAKQDPDSKSAKSLKNWGHDPQKSTSGS